MATFDAALAPVVDAWVAEHAATSTRQALVDAARASLATYELLSEPMAGGGGAAARDAHRGRSRRSPRLVRWWALLGGLLAAGARGDVGAERGLEPRAATGRSRPTTSSSST